MAPLLTEKSFLRISCGTDQGIEINSGLPFLAGNSVENLFPSAKPAGKYGDFALSEIDGWRLGVASVDLTHGLEATAHQLYLDLFATTQGLHLARIWNYVPAINMVGHDGLENYHLFCRGRSLAFEGRFGVNFKSVMPAASAVGCMSPRLTIVFVAAPVLPRHVENPRQVPAYDYPAEHGPRSPSFSRATIVQGPASTSVFISGTASIRGHATIASHGINEQLECMLENLREISIACGLGPDLCAGKHSTRNFKVYVRNRKDLSVVTAAMEKRLLLSNDIITFLQADICRAPLLVEIEASLFDINASTD